MLRGIGWNLISMDRRRWEKLSEQSIKQFKTLFILLYRYQYQQEMKQSYQNLCGITKQQKETLLIVTL